MNMYASTASEVVAILISGVIQNQIGFKYTLLLGYAMAGVCGFVVTCSSGESELLYALFVLLSRFGICITFNMNYIATQRLFPSVVLATVFGITNVFARFTTVLAPLIAEKPEPYPMAIFSSISMLCCLVALGLDTEKQYAN